MRYELTDNEWSAIKPMLPNKPRGVPRVNYRRVLNGIFWVLRSGAPWLRVNESALDRLRAASTIILLCRRRVRLLPPGSGRA